MKINGKFEHREIENLDLNELQIESYASESKELTNFGYDKAFKMSGNFEYEKSMYTVGDEIVVVITNDGRTSGNQNKKVLKGNIVGISETPALLYDKT